MTGLERLQPSTSMARPSSARSSATLNHLQFRLFAQALTIKTCAHTRFGRALTKDPEDSQQVVFELAFPELRASLYFKENAGQIDENIARLIALLRGGLGVHPAGPMN